MPDKIIEIPNVGRIAFPDTMKPEEIEAAAAKLYQESNAGHPKPAKEHSWMDTAIDWIPTAAGAAGGIIGGLAGAAGGLGIGAVPGAAAGAALGGATGQAVKNMLTDDPAQPMGARQALGSMAKEGAIQGGMELVGGGVVAPAMRRVGSALMQSAVKPGLKATAAAIAKGVPTEDLPIVKTLLKEKVNVTPGGIAKLDKIMSATNKEIRDILENTPGSVLPENVATRTQAVAARVANQVDNEADLSAVQNVTKRFLGQGNTTTLAQTGTKQVPSGVLDASGRMLTKAEPVMGRVSRPLALTEAQDLKTGTYRALKEKAYGELKGPEIEAQKALARGLKEEIEAEAKKAGKDIASLNAREGSAITAKEAIAKRIAQAGNRDPLSLAWLAANPTAGLLFVMERSPAVKSMLARGLYNSASKAARVPENVLRMLVHGVASSTDEDSE
ncbi:MAG TPA: hypothetical protein VHL34_24575 [Rhizomicrobium sp.]|jgi:hypothetical protein|nr:hypothetical protein [Rhizomicrobium sp.]